MRLSPLFVSLAIAAPGILASVIVQMTAEDSSLTIFGIEGGRKNLAFQTTDDTKYILTSTDQEEAGMETRLKLKAGNASFRHTSDGKYVNCRIEGFPSGDLTANKDFAVHVEHYREVYTTAWNLASLSDTSAQPCAERAGMKLVCGEHFKAGGGDGDGDRPPELAGGAAGQGCTRR
ncbi:uncharacterized protein MKK02DRAFT_30565 [Dioszegia hungarica]|uniref:Uncharacterized protein n=1 Tax=Dioszegia hungarica TaxID=4972 RepID=A0AA38LTP9_9TREE|nr:uncharacterized protein MKK02DRAFT_30565 [Dioszegia hungarica]KAI9632836.1 hypothetical protein MKK02DRAFT_30565 [Dioszegia hungarica]